MKKNFIIYLIISCLSIWMIQVSAKDAIDIVETNNNLIATEIEANALAEENTPMSSCEETFEVKEMNDCSKKVYQNTEKQLKAIIFEIESSLEYIEKRLFKKSHRQWNSFYKNYCEFATYMLKEEPGFPFHQYDCFDRATRHYMQSLEIFLESLDI
ncbi:MAG: DUF1311 domain-containing protein [Thiomargarita sp.]|nr:DUF1311 domain-containing protein [Thiomargarita sp.]